MSSESRRLLDTSSESSEIAIASKIQRHRPLAPTVPSHSANILYDRFSALPPSTSASTFHLPPPPPITISSSSITTTKYGTLDSSVISLKRSQLLDNYPKTQFTRKQLWIGVAAFMIFGAAIAVTLTLGLPRFEAKRREYFAAKFIPSPISEELFDTNLVMVDSAPECAAIGENILRRENGSAIDAALAALFCTQIAAPHSAGHFGGGFQLLYYSGQNGTAYSLDASNQLIPLHHHNNNDDDLEGEHKKRLLVSMPGLIPGAQLAYRHFGKLNFSTLLEPSILLAQKNSVGVRVTKNMAFVLQRNRAVIENNHRLRHLFRRNENNSLFSNSNDSKVGGDTDSLDSSSVVEESVPLLQEGDQYTNQLFADLLQQLSDYGPGGADESTSTNHSSNFIIQRKLVDDINQFLLSSNKSDRPLNESEIFDQYRAPVISAPSNYSLFDSSSLDLLTLSPMSGIPLAQFLLILDGAMTERNTGSPVCNDNSRSLKEGAYEFHYVIEALKIIRSHRMDWLQLQELTVLNKDKIDEIVKQLVSINIKQDNEQLKRLAIESNNEIGDEDKEDPLGMLNLVEDKTMDKRASGNNQIIVFDSVSGDVVALTTTGTGGDLFVDPKTFIYSPKTGIFLKTFEIDERSSDGVSLLSHRSPSPVMLIDRAHQSGPIVRLVSTGTDGTRSQIITAMAQVLYKILLDCQSVKSATDESRFFIHYPSSSSKDILESQLEELQEILYEAEFPQAYLDLLVRLFDYYNLKPIVSPINNTPAIYTVYRVEAPSIQIDENGNDLSRLNAKNHSQLILSTGNDSTGPISSLDRSIISRSYQLSAMVDFRKGGFVTGN